MTDVAGFNAWSEEAAIRTLLDCCAVPEWAVAVAAGRPYADLPAVLTAADAALAALPESGIDRALAGHPRIGERPDTAASAREQSGVADSGDAVRAALAEGNAAYERRFGHIYLVCASGRSGEELLALLNARLDNDPDTERAIVRAELAAINRLRLRRCLGDGGAP